MEPNIRVRIHLVNLQQDVEVADMNALEILRQDHRKVADLFEEFKTNEDGDSTSLFEEIIDELEFSAHIEETVLYPRLTSDGDEELEKLVYDGLDEHRQVKLLLDEISSVTDAGETLNAKLKMLMEDVEHYVEEEENEMFPLIEKKFDECELEDLGRDLEVEKAFVQSGGPTFFTAQCETVPREI